MANSRQAEHFQRATLERLRALIPSECPLIVERAPGGGFVVRVMNADNRRQGRAEVVGAWIDGYLASWRACV